MIGCVDVCDAFFALCAESAAVQMRLCPHAAANLSRQHCLAPRFPSLAPPAPLPQTPLQAALKELEADAESLVEALAERSFSHRLHQALGIRLQLLEALVKRSFSHRLGLKSVSKVR